MNPLYLNFLANQKLLKGLTQEELLFFSTLISVEEYPTGVNAQATPGSRSIWAALSNPAEPLTAQDIAAYFLQSFVQEWIGRGILQNALQKFLDDDKGVKTVLGTSLVFGMLHLSRGVAAGGVAFVGAMFMGLLYVRHHNLIGVSLLHFVLGLMVINYFGWI